MKKLFCNGVFIFYDEKKNRFQMFKGNMLVVNGHVSCFTDKIIEKIETIDLHGNIIVPAFVNMHLHLGDLTFRPIKKMTLLNYIKYTEQRNLLLGPNQQRVWELSAKATLDECLKSGTLVVNTIRGQNILKNYPFKSFCGYPIMLSKKLKHYYDKGINGYKIFFKECKKCNVLPLVFIHSLYSNNKKSILFAKKCLNRNKTFCAIHVAEDTETEMLVFKKWQKRSIDILNEYKLLNKRTILIHGGVLEDHELALVKKKKSTIVLCPVSNKNLLTKCLNPNELIKKKINWCIGTDGLATGENGDLLLQAKVLLQYGISATSILESLTINATKILKLKKYILSKGSLANFNVYENCPTVSVEDVLTQIFNLKLKHIAVYKEGFSIHCP